MLENKKGLNEIEDDDLLEVAGGGTYTKDGFLKTTARYSCEHFKCKSCGESGVHTHQGMGVYTVQDKCNNCRWHTTLRCDNPVNKR